MNVFSLDRHLIREYASFARSFTKIRANDIADQVEQIYAQGTFWPEPLVSINPHYQSGSTLADLVRAGDLCADIENVFRFDGKQVKLYKHQSQAVAKAAARPEFRSNDRHRDLENRSVSLSRSSMRRSAHTLRLPGRSGRERSLSTP